MSHVYRIGSVYGVTYVSTAREANRCNPNGERPESINCLDAVAECQRLSDEVDRLDAAVGVASQLIDGLWGMMAMPDDGVDNRVAAFLKAHPPSPATASDRDGGRSYGT
jgi:hypothetical protein